MFSNKKTREYEAREKTLQEEIGLLRDRCAALEAGKALADGRREKECGEREALRQEAERLRERCAGLQADNDRVYAGHRGLEEEINFLKYRIGTLDELHESVAFGYWPHDGSFRDYTCKYPFERIEILPRGEVYTCCSGYIKHDYYIGNIYGDHESFGEIWNSDRARKLRYSVQEGNFEFCQKKCRFFHMPAGGDNPITLKDGPSPRKGWQDFAVTAAPKYITLSCDESCNLQCPSCRSHAKALNKEDSDRLYDRLINIVRPMLRDCELLGALGTGELFASSALSRFFKTINAREFPKLSLIITTNLQLVNEAKWEEFSNLLEIPKTIRVSMDGASKGTYEENRRGGYGNACRKTLPACAG